MSTHLPAGETIANSLAVDETGGVFVVSSHALYRFDAGSGGAPQQTWRQTYDRGVRQKPGQTQWGSGTTPTIIRRGSAHYVAITDNADPRMHVLVFRADRTGTGGKPLCSAPVFASGKGSTDNSLIAVGDSLIVENNYGYTGPVAAASANPPPSPSRPTPTTEPGVTRIDVNFDSGSCHAAWTNSTVRVPTSVSKASAAAGLVYVYSHPAANEVRYRSPASERRGPVVPHRARSADRARAVVPVHRRRARLQQQLRADHPRPGRHRLHRHARRVGVGAGHRRGIRLRRPSAKAAGPV